MSASAGANVSATTTASLRRSAPAATTGATVDPAACGAPTASADPIAAVGAYLQDAVLPGVAQEQRSELRAAIKLLQSAARELDELPGVLGAQIAELRTLCAAAEWVLDPGNDEPVPAHREPPATLTVLRARDDEARAAAGRAIEALQQHLRTTTGEHEPAERVLAGLFEALGRHAARRMAWQSVFPVAPDTEGASR